MKRALVLVMLSAGITPLTACHGGIGTITETYVNQTNTRQVLEFSTKETVKGFIGRELINTDGHYVFHQGQSVIEGTYSRPDEHGEPRPFIINVGANAELRLWEINRGSLRDESGTVWKLQTRSHKLRSVLF